MRHISNCGTQCRSVRKRYQGSVGSHPSSRKSIGCITIRCAPFLWLLRITRLSDKGYMFLFLFSYRYMCLEVLDSGADCSALLWVFLCLDARCKCFPYFRLLLLAVYPPCTPFTVIGEVRTEKTVQAFENVLYRLGITEYGYRLFTVLYDFRLSAERSADTVGCSAVSVGGCVVFRQMFASSPAVCAYRSKSFSRL